MNCLAILFLSVFILSTLVASELIEMKLLVISTNKPNSVIKTLQSYNIPFDYQEYNAENQLKGNLTLYDENNNPKYSGIVFGNGQLSDNFGDQGWRSVFTNEQWEYLHEYERNFGIRCVALEDGPRDYYGTHIFDASKWGTSEVQNIKIAENNETEYLFGQAGIKTSISLNTKGLYHTPMSITNSTLAVPIMYFEPNEMYTEESVAAALITTADNREILSFYLTFGDWSINSVIINHLWVSWITRSLYSGNRKVIFSTHIDDVFISTGKVDMVKNEIESEDVYRSSSEDFEILAKWQKDVEATLPEGSSIKSELAFNGNGILASIDYEYSVPVDGERYVDLEYKKEPGTGKSRWPVTNYTLSYDAEFLKKDPLFKYFSDEEKQKNFFWSSHTFTHENLDDATTTDVENEIKTNIEVAKLLGVYGKSYWSDKSIITPQISGLRNADALAVFKKYGIEYGIGDLSRPTLSNTENPYLPFITTNESSNYEGFSVIPRSPTEVYYSSSTTEENTHLYNMMYESLLGNSTWEEILERESDRVLVLLLNLRNEAYQFHQINTRSHDLTEKESILQKWSNAVFSKYTSIVDWPITSLKLDDLTKKFMDRYELNEYCDISRSMVYSGKFITDIKIVPNSIKKDCKVPITVPDGVKEVDDKRFKYEKIGKDRLTVWVEFKKGETESQIITLSPPLQWEGALSGSAPASCWSEPFYPCCKEDENVVEYIDDDGWWGITNEAQPQWCGIIKDETCWAKAFGLPCCENDTPDYILEGNVLGYEFKYENDTTRPAGGWCGLPGAAELVNKDAKTIFAEQLQ